LYKIVRRPPCWKSTARLARHARLDLLDWLDKVERVESSRVESSQVEFEPIGLHKIPHRLSHLSLIMNMSVIFYTSEKTVPDTCLNNMFWTD